MAASLPAVAVSEPMVGSILGIAILGETLRPGESGWFVLGLAVVAMVFATVALARESSDDHPAVTTDVPGSGRWRVGVLAAIALIPSPPVLVPHLAGAAAGEVAGFRDAALFTAAAGLPDRWVVIGAARAVTSSARTPAARSLNCGGVDVPVTLSPQAPTPSARCRCAR